MPKNNIKKPVKRCFPVVLLLKLTHMHRGKIKDAYMFCLSIRGVVGYLGTHTITSVYIFIVRKVSSCRALCVYAFDVSKTYDTTGILISLPASKKFAGRQRVDGKLYR